METLASIIPTLQVGIWVGSLDFKDAYLHNPIARLCSGSWPTSTKGRPSNSRLSPVASPRPTGSPPGSRGQWLPSFGSAAYCSSHTWTTDLSWGTRRLRPGPTWGYDHPPHTRRLGDQFGEIASHPSLIYLGSCLDLAQGRAFPSEERIAVLH